MSFVPTTPVQVSNGVANPAPLGLCAFGMTTVLLNLHNAGFFEMNTMILAMGIFYGGLAQVIAGIIEAKRIILSGLLHLPLMAFSGCRLWAYWYFQSWAGVLPHLKKL